MSTPAILGLMTGVPERRFTQEEILHEFIRLLEMDPTARRARAMRPIFERAGVRYRHAVIDGDFYSVERRTQSRNDIYMEEAVPLGEDTIQRGLQAAGYTPQDVDDLIVVSCTGFSIPGLDLHLAGRLEMRPDLRRTCVLGMGCYGAFPGLLRARQAVNGESDRLALVLAIELCSLHFQKDRSAENIVAGALFADGAAMALVGSKEPNGSHAHYPRLVHSATHCDYTTLEHMAFTLTDHGFRMYLSSYVPDLLAAKVTEFVGDLLQRAGLEVGDVRFWGIHPGSSRIVDYIQEQLSLTDEQVEFSHSILHDYGNMSSATILFVLDQIQRCGHPEPGDYGVLMAFGPGLTMEGLLVQW